MKRNRVCYVLALIMVCFAVFMFGERNAYPVMYAIIAMPGIALLSLFAAPRFININEYFEKTDAYKNEPLRYSVRVTIKKPFNYPGLGFLFASGNFARYDLVSAGEYLLTFPYRGKYAAGIERFFVMDFLGLFRFGYSVKTPAAAVTVFPEIVEHFTLDLKNEFKSHADSANATQSGSQTDVSDVRKYAPTDDYRKIHWKLTAKRNDLIVKDYLSPVLNKTYVVLDTKAPQTDADNKLRIEDKMVSYALSALYFCVNMRIPAALCVKDKTEVRNRGDFDTVCRYLAEVGFTDESAAAEVLTGFLRQDDCYDIAVFTVDVDDNLFAALSGLSQMGHNAAVFCGYGFGLYPDETALNRMNVLKSQRVTVNMLCLE